MQDTKTQWASLPWDAKLEIAKQDSAVWILLCAAERDFNIFSETMVGWRLFVDTFTVMSTERGISYTLLGKLHRDNDLPAFISTNGDQHWFKNNHFHRDNDLPAFISDRHGRAWYQRGKKHRDNGLPAQISADGIHLRWYRRGLCTRFDSTGRWQPDGVYNCCD